MFLDAGSDALVIVRRLGFAALVGALTVPLLLLGFAVLAPGGWSLPKALLGVCLALTSPWLALSAATAMVGFTVRMAFEDPAPAVLPALRRASASEPIRLRTAVAMAVRNEAVEPIEARLRRLIDELARCGASDRFTVCVLSDTSNKRIAEAEVAAVTRLRASAKGGRVLYRRRADNVGWKAGNVMDFLDGHAEEFDSMLCLDADSSMTASAVARMVRVMQADEQLAIVQATIAGAPTAMPFPRLLQFGERSGARIWATGQAWWQGDRGSYWGHNALIRIAPFRAHARLGRLRRGGHVLSHDHVEAAKLHAAGWGVRVLPDDAGSTEEHPTSLLAYLQRDARWAAGNFQYFALLLRRDLSMLGRLQMLQAALYYVLAPAWFGLIPSAALLGALGEAGHLPRAALLTLLGSRWLFLYAAKLLGYAELLLGRDGARHYGGRAAVLGSAFAETCFTAMLDPILAVQRTALVLGMRLRPDWGGQDRRGRRLSWREAARVFWPHSLIGTACMGLFAATSPLAVVLGFPACAGLLCAVPFAVLTSDRGVGAWLARRRVAAMPEELAEPCSERFVLNGS